ncbi:MAG: hypothetical protein M3Y33_15405 [Actinomycetota bacterium]|nr:hypothetical protein [Actinomycetota bacterium]
MAGELGAVGRGGLRRPVGAGDGQLAGPRVQVGAWADDQATHNRPEVLEAIRGQLGQRMEAEDIADAIACIVTGPRHVAVSELLIRPTEQER